MKALLKNNFSCALLGSQQNFNQKAFLLQTYTMLAVISSHTKAATMLHSSLYLHIFCYFRQKSAINSNANNNNNEVKSVTTELRKLTKDKLLALKPFDPSATKVRKINDDSTLQASTRQRVGAL